MTMLRRIKVHATNLEQREKQGNYDILGRENITLKVRLCWRGHILRMEKDEGNKVKQTMKTEMEVLGQKEHQD